jgi:hypothetical protein
MEHVRDVANSEARAAASHGSQPGSLGCVWAASVPLETTCHAKQRNFGLMGSTILGLCEPSSQGRQCAKWFEMRVKPEESGAPLRSMLAAVPIAHLPDLRLRAGVAKEVLPIECFNYSPLY